MSGRNKCWPEDSGTEVLNYPKGVLHYQSPIFYMTAMDIENGRYNTELRVRDR
jgi:hypothetical protein